MSAPFLKIELNPALKAAGNLIALVAARPIPPLEADAISRDEAVVEAYRNNPDIIIKALSARLGDSGERTGTGREEVSEWQVPVLTLHGDADRLTPVEGSTQFFETVAVKTLDTFEDGYHELLNDHERDRALTTIVDWLKARLPAGPA